LPSFLLVAWGVAEHADFDSVLARYVQDGPVDYAALQLGRASLVCLAVVRFLESGEYQIRFPSYDWTLNDQAIAASGR